MSLNVSPISMYKPPEMEETEGVSGGTVPESEKVIDEAVESEEKGGEPEVKGTKGKGIDLNDLARKQGLMADEEFQALLDGEKGKEDDGDKRTENPDLTTLKAKGTTDEEVTEEQVTEAAQSIGRAESEGRPERKQAEASTQSGANVTPTEIPKNVKKKLELMAEAVAKERQTRRTSKRHLEQELKKQGQSDSRCFKRRM